MRLTPRPGGGLPKEGTPAEPPAAVLALLQVLSQPDAAQQGFDPSIFISPDKLHLTLLMLKLYSDEARHKAAQALQGLRPQVRSLGSRLQGGCQRVVLQQQQHGGACHMACMPAQ